MIKNTLVKLENKYMYIRAISKLQSWATARAAHSHTYLPKNQ